MGKCYLSPKVIYYIYCKPKTLTEDAKTKQKKKKKRRKTCVREFFESLDAESANELQRFALLVSKGMYVFHDLSRLSPPRCGPTPGSCKIGIGTCMYIQNTYIHNLIAINKNLIT